MPPSVPTLYTIKRVAAMLDVRPKFIYLEISYGHLQALKLTSRRMRISEQSLIEYIEKRTTKVVARNECDGKL